MHDNTEALRARIKAFEPQLRRILASAGTPGVSFGVSQKGKIVYEASFGKRDIESGLPIDQHTIVPMGTMAKTFTASAIGVLVSQGRLRWDTPIREILSGFESRDATVHKELSVIDLLCHRSGLARSNFWWQGAQSQTLLEKKDLLEFYARFPRTGAFRADWAYSNWGYAVIGAVIETLSGMTYGDFLKKYVLSPLGLDDTTFKAFDYDASENFAKPYAAMDDASMHLLPLSRLNEDTIMCAAMGGVSSAHDLLRYSVALLKAHGAEVSGKSATSSDDSPIKHALMQLSGHVYTSPHTMEKSYAFGWYRSQLPSTVLGMGWNSIYVQKMPALVPRGQSGPVIAHGGSLPGYHTAVALLPALESSVVVCTNSIALGDVSGWTSLAMIEALIDTPQPSDFVALAAEAALSNKSAVPKLFAKLEQGRCAEQKNAHRDLDKYVGRYSDKLHGWKIQICLGHLTTDLEIRFCELESQGWRLWSLGGDTFSWLASREEQAKRCRMTTYPLVPGHFLIDFKASPEGNIIGLYWAHEAGLARDAQFFAKV